jgi:hypothetical protein
MPAAETDAHLPGERQGQHGGRSGRCAGSESPPFRCLSKMWFWAIVLASLVSSQSFIAPSNAAKKSVPTASPGHRQRSGSPAPASASQVVTPMPGICDTANVTDLFSDLSDESTKRDQIALLQGRIVECTRKIGRILAQLPSPSPTPYWLPAIPVPAPTRTASPECTTSAPATMSSNRFALYEKLGRCFAYLTYLNALPTPAPTESPLAQVASRPTFYVFATGAADPTAGSVLIRSVVDRLMKAQRNARLARARGPGDTLWDLSIVGRADWTETASFASQCQLDPNTRGALVIETSIPETYRANYLLIVANFTNVSASMEMLGCGALDHDPSVSPLSLWNYQALTGKAHQDALTLGILTSIAAYFSKTKTTTTVNTGQGTTTVTRTEVAPPILTGNALTFFQTENLNLPAQNASVQLTVAGERLADSTMKRLRMFCLEPEIRRLAADADPTNVPPPPLEHRTLLYKAAFEYLDTCGLFANFEVAPRRGG